MSNITRLCDDHCLDAEASEEHPCLVCRLERDLAVKDSEVSAVISTIPNSIRVRESNGSENIYASLAVSVARVLHDLTAAIKRIAELEQALERARVVQRGYEEGR